MALKHKENNKNIKYYIERFDLLSRPKILDELCNKNKFSRAEVLSILSNSIIVPKTYLFFNACLKTITISSNLGHITLDKDRKNGENSLYIYKPLLDNLFKTIKLYKSIIKFER